MRTSDEGLALLNEVTEQLVGVAKDSAFKWAVMEDQPSVYVLPFQLAASASIDLHEVQTLASSRGIVRRRLIDAHEDVIALCKKTIRKLEDK